MGKPKRKAPEPKKGLPSWMATFSDMVTLLLTFFVMLMGMANFDESTKVRSVIESIRQAFGVSGLSMQMVGLREEPEYPSISVQIDTVAPREFVPREGSRAKQDDTQDRVVRQNGEVRIRLGEEIFFRAGSDELHPTAFGRVRSIAEAVADLDVAVDVEGHTDPTGDEDENWGLSARRAASVVAAMRRTGVPGEKLAAVGRGPFAPAVGQANDVAWNRRIEFVIRGDQLDVSHVVERLRASDIEVTL